MRRKPIALIDMDGTLCDFDKALQNQLHPFRPSTESIVSHNDHEKEEWQLVNEGKIKNTSGFWKNLEKFKLGFDILEEVQKFNFDCHILTKGPVRSSNAWTEKFEWCQQHLPNIPITITMDKSLVYGKILIDDYPPYFESWLKYRPRGYVIVPAQKWNENYKIKSDRILRYDGSNLTDVIEILNFISKTYSAKDI